MRDATETSHETQVYDDFAYPTILWLGDKKEETFTAKLKDYLDTSPAWYWLVGGTNPQGPFNTSTEAFENHKKATS